MLASNKFPYAFKWKNYKNYCNGNPLYLHITQGLLFLIKNIVIFPNFEIFTSYLDANTNFTANVITHNSAQMIEDWCTRK